MHWTDQSHKRLTLLLN